MAVIELEIYPGFGFSGNTKIVTRHLPDPIRPDFAFFSLAPLVVNLHAKFEVSSTNRTRHMEGVPTFQK